MKRQNEELIQARFEDWLAALEHRHLADLRPQELTRALRALSSAYVERRHTTSRGNPLGGAGKRAAFALFYAPLHFLAAAHVVRALGADAPPPSTILDVGCGTGAAGAAWAVCTGSRSFVRGIDRHAWALDEARWTYHVLGLRGSVRRGDAAHMPAMRPGTAAIAAYVLNELSGERRAMLEDRLFDAAAQGARVLVLEPIARSITPWWGETAARAVGAGGRADEWRFPAALPPLLRRLDHAAGLNHRELTVRSIWIPSASR